MMTRAGRHAGEPGGGPDGVAPGVEFQRVSKAFDTGSGRVGLRELSFQVPPGSTAALVGPNGVGKTTALRVAATLVAPTTGHAFVSGLDCVRAPARVRALLGVSLGGPRSFYWRLSAAHNLAFFAVLRGAAPVRAGSLVRALADELGFAGALTAPARGLSRGTLGRMAIARALLCDPDVILLDEPFAAIDASGRELVWDALRRRVDAGASALIATHDLSVAGRCDAVIRPAT